MRLLHTAAGLDESTGGPASSVSNLCAALAGRGHRVTLLTGAGRFAPSVARLSGRVTLAAAPLGPYSLANASRRFARECGARAASSDVVHTHGLWLHPNWTSAAAARRHEKPLVISPRGMLEPWSLGRSRWLKLPLWHLVERRSFSRAAFVHATGGAEARSIRRLGVRSPIAVIPNGIDLHEEFEQGKIEALRRSASSGRSLREVVFLGRIHPKKGLPLLLEAWQRIASRFPDAELGIYGPGEADRVAELEHRIAAMEASGARYGGSVWGDQKVELLARATVLVLPSLSENYGMVVAEALASQTPVITTTETPWTKIEECACGWRVPPEAPAIAEALEQALDSTGERMREMGKRGRALIEQEHCLDRVGQMMEQTYRWALGRSERPEWLEDDELP